MFDSNLDGKGLRIAVTSAMCFGQSLNSNIIETSGYAMNKGKVFKSLHDKCEGEN